MPQILVDVDYLLYYRTKTASITSKRDIFSSFFVLIINIFVLPNNFMVVDVYNSSLYPSFILNANVLLNPLMYI